MSVILFIIILLVLIIGHELGHFSIAKWVGMKVPEFGVGFPPKLWGWKVGGTEYTINALPFGGFVKIVGEDGENQDHPDAFGNKSRWAQAATLAAGPGMNIVLGFLALWLALMIGVPAVVTDTSAATIRDAHVTVVQVIEKSPAAVAGVRVGDELVDFVPTEEPLTLTIVRDGEQISFDLVPAAGVIAEAPERKAIGIASARIGTQVLDPLHAFGAAVLQTGTALGQIVVGLVTLIGNAFVGSASLQDVSGPVGIASLVGEASVFGAGQVLVLTAIISLNLAVINLLPLPALDGGRLALLLYERVRRRAVPQGVIQLINATGFLALILLMVFVTWHDIARLVA